MNKKYLSILVIVITLILSVYMIVFRNINNEDFTLVDSTKKNDVESANSNLDEKIEAFLRSIEDSNIDSMSENAKKSDKNESNKENTITKKTDTPERLDESNLLESIEESAKSDKIEFKNNAQSEIFSPKDDLQTSMPVFKIDKMLILDDMSFHDKATITKMITKLSMQDYTLILDSIKKYGELECVEKINHILKSRLDYDDYEAIEEIFEKYINLELIN